MTSRNIARQADERRSAPRSLRLRSGTIIFNDKQSVMSFQLRDLSATGARLKFVNSLGAPEEFIISVPGAIEKRWARRVWMKYGEIGVQFNDS